MFGYIYKTTNLINGKIYVGRHRSEVFDTRYFGSSKSLLTDIRIYGKHNFKCEILEWGESLEQLAELEIKWIKLLDSTNPDIGYNISDGGLGCSGMFGEKNQFYGKHHTEETKKLISDKAKLREPMSDYTKSLISSIHKGKHHSDETKKKIGDAQRGIPRGPMSEETKLKISKTTKQMYKDGMRPNLTGEDHPAFGTHISEEHKQKIAKAQTGRIKSSEERYKLSVAKKGVKLSDEHKQKIGLNGRGRIWINNGIISKMIKKQELPTYLSNGFSLGRLKSK